jgi:hypothetical protein
MTVPLTFSRIGFSSAPTAANASPCATWPGASMAPFSGD